MKKKILIVEDDAAVVDFLLATLESDAYDLASALDGKAGLEKAGDFKPDLVILDLMMPKMHGYQVCQKIKDDEAHRGVKILVTSAKSYSADLEQAKQAGADGYLVKPYTPQELLEAVRSLIGPSGASNGESLAKSQKQLLRTPLLAEGAPRSASDAAAAPSSLASSVPAADLAVKVRFWGTRGSSPAPGPHTVRYGGNTSCTELRIGDQLIIIDCGTGVRELGIALLEEFREKPILGDIFVGHTHWDHIQGFPFFTPLYIPRNRFMVHSVRAAGKSLEKVFRGQMAADYFPVPLQSLSSSLHFREIDGPVQLGPVRVTYHFLNHPGVAIGFRFDLPGKSVTYISDHETFGRLNPPSEVTRKQDAGIVEFARDSDLLICEAQYTEEEYKLKRGWGHSTLYDVVDRAMQSGSKQLALFHHDPTHTDAMMDRLVSQCQQRVKDAGSLMVCFGAQEGQVITL